MGLQIILAWIGGITLYYIIGFLSTKYMNWICNSKSGPEDYFIPVIAPLVVALAIVGTFIHSIDFIIKLGKRLNKLEEDVKKLNSQNRRNMK